MVPKLNNVKLPPVSHVGVFVKSLKESSAYYTRTLGLGPWTFAENNPTKEQMLVGEPFKLDVCFADWGPVVFELLEPKSENSFWSNYISKHGEGIHHTCHMVPNFDEVVAGLEKHGAKMIAGSWYKTIRWCYMQLNSGGLVIEIMEEGEL